MIYDIIVVGGGIAGLMAAIEAKNATNKVALLTKGNLFKSNSSLASGGINAVLERGDKSGILKHIEDTYKATYGLGDKKSIEYMCKRASYVIEKLVQYGVDFDKDEEGNIAQRSFGGGSVKRTCYVADKTGSAITAALIKKAKSVGVNFVVNTFVMNITKLENQVSGVVALRRFDSSVVVYPAKAVVLAGGGYAGIYRGYSTNAQDFTGDMHAIALRAGLNLKDMEFVQFHPTGLVKTSYLISEAARGEGGYLVNSKGERFVDELGTRDVVSRAIAKQIEAGEKVFIDLRHLSKKDIETKLPSLQKAALMQAGVDVTTELLPIKPVAHYSMGGIENKRTCTAIKGLFVCGECGASGIHGANRLGGNSLLEAAVFGELAGKNALSFSEHKELLPIDYNIVAKDVHVVDYIFRDDTSKNFNAMRINLGNVMFKHAGIYRDKEGLEKAFDYLSYLRKEASTLHCTIKDRVNNVELISILELKNALEVAEAVVLSAKKRKESRGAHSREDYPKSNKKYEKSILINEIKKGFFKLWFEDGTLMSNFKKRFTNLT
ncbi:MAG TPA: L-aspartate oxidase [Sulfurospirillum sp. UBA11407]|jgi:succinate dehydrogenase/fumarate reductase flavoprotein subunit|nr:MAG TPA: L-aspartate oxidase [Sulfurospirillum sp. UBA11407]DAB35443.1 MAG TPA: L-aspartate oxidase [Sulfurospirillum sp. UBA12182]